VFFLEVVKMRRFSIIIVGLTAFMLGLIWVVGTGEAIQKPQTKTIFLADTVHINLNEPSESSKSEIEAEETRETLFKEIKKFNQTVYDIKNRYMEEVDIRELINAGIRGMLVNLDRFSVLMEKTSYDRLMESTQGKYEGLGMEIDSRDDYIIVVTPMEGTPAYRVGLRPGDQIRKIDGQSTYKMSTADAAKLMRGQAGTSVNLTVFRQGLGQALDFEVERAVIELKSVNYYGVIEGTDIGYVRLSRFAEETSHELRAAITDLNNQGIEALIFDLRSNGGGLLQQAVETAELFIDEGKLVVYTRGKFPGTERRHYSKNPPLFTGKPLAILVNEGTASASEIVAGAVQDWDRGVILGHPTYGKGLVQQIFPIGSDGEVALKLTTAKYYIPSGRCIQKPETARKDGPEDEFAESDDVSDSVTTDSLRISDKEIYYTNGGRAVYGGGGILPDLEIDEPRTYQPLEINLERKRMFFDFAVKYVAEHKTVPLEIEITDDITKEFREYIKSKDFSYKTALEISLEEMKEVIEKEGKDSIFTTALVDFEEVIDKEKEADFEKSLDYIKKALKREIVSKIAGERGIYEEVILETDPSVLRAIELLKNRNEYARILEEGVTKTQSAVAGEG
jgi:carboxyl-terminal processing protease